MKWTQLLVWITQLGMSVVVSLGGFLALSVWLQRRYELGVWVIVCGVVLGLMGAISALKNSLKTMERIADDGKEEKKIVSFNDHE